MTTITVQPASRAPTAQVHGNSMHPKVRAVLDKGMDAEWTTADVEALLGLSPRGTQYLFEKGLLHVSRYPSTGTIRPARRTTGLSLLLYIINHSDEITEADVQPVMRKVLPLLTDQILEGVIGACRALISKRSGLMVAVKHEMPAPEAAAQSAPPEAAAQSAPPEAAPQSAPSRPKADPYKGMADLFPAPQAG